jgi:hypothetical protein
MMDFPESDQAVIQIIENCDGAIFGGYIRDFYAGVQPSDMDVILYRIWFKDFQTAVEPLGYRYIPPKDKKWGVHRFTKEGSIPLEIILEDYDENHPHMILGPCSTPDASVNLLTYFRHELFNWMDGDISPTDIVAQIKKKETWIFKDADPERIEKILLKGYKKINF